MRTSVATDRADGRLHFVRLEDAVAAYVDATHWAIEWDGIDPKEW
jgi:hypothetical protein